MKLVAINKQAFSAWKAMRKALYKGVDNRFHEEDMNWI